MRGLLTALAMMSMAGACFQAQASSLLFTSTAQGGAVAVTIGSSVTAITAQDDTITAPSGADVALAFANNSGAGFNTNFTSTSNITGEIDFSDTVGTQTSGTCDADKSNKCKVDASTTFGSSTTVSGLTQQDNTVAAAAQNQWNNWITAATGWNSVGTAADISGSSTVTLCAGSGSGCTYTATTAQTVTIHGVQQTAYVFDLTTASLGADNANVVINGNGTGAIVILNYVASTNGNNALSSSKAFTLAGGLTDDQVLLNVEGGGFTTSSGFSFNGDVSIQGADADLANATIHGRLYVDTSGNSQSDELGVASGAFNLIAPADEVAPEPGSIFLMGIALLGLAVLAKKRFKQTTPVDAE